MKMVRGIGVAVFAAALLGAASLPAQAVTITALAPGNLNTGGNVETFDSTSVGPNPSYYSSVLGATFTGGSFENGTTSGISAAPWMGAPDATNYAAAGPTPGTPMTILFNNAVNGLSMYIGSIDTYNTIDFYSGVSLVGSVTGAMLVASDPSLMASGCQNSYSCNRGFLFGGMGMFDKVSMNSSQNALEFDNVGATPIPAALPLFATVLGGGGFLTWRRKRKQALKGSSALAAV